MLDIPENVQLEQQELELAPEVLELAAEELAPEVPAANGEVQGVGDAEQLQLQVPHEGQIVFGEVLPHQIEVDGNVLTVASSLATLRAACGFYGVSRSGSNATCYRRLSQHQKTLELLSAQAAIAQTQGVVERHPNAQTLVKPPDPKQQELHELTHTPYEPWCTTCLKHRARPDPHRRTGEAHNTGIPIVSMDFCVTKKKYGMDPHPEGAPDDKGALWCFDLQPDWLSWSGSNPRQRSDQLHDPRSAELCAEPWVC